MNAIRKYTRIAKWRRRQCGYRKLKEAMIDILGLKIKQTRLEFYGLNIYQLDNNDIDVLFEIMKKKIKI